MTKEEITLAVVVGIAGNLVTAFLVVPLLSWGKPRFLTWVLTRSRRVEHFIFGWVATRRTFERDVVIFGMMAVLMAVVVTDLHVIRMGSPPVIPPARLKLYIRLSAAAAATSASVAVYLYLLSDMVARSVRQYDHARALYAAYVRPEVLLKADSDFTKIGSKAEFDEVIEQLREEAYKSGELDPVPANACRS